MSFMELLDLSAPVVAVILLIVLIFKRRIHSIGKDGIQFADGDIAQQLREFMARSDAADISMQKDIAGVKDDVMRLRKESLKTQILLQETSFERKLYLYDEYKELGGNGWMDIFINELKAKHN